MAVANIAGRIAEITGRVAAENNLELVNVEVVGSERAPIVRIFIDRLDVETGKSAVTHEDCVAVSLYVGTILDVEDFISSAYTLEVSSPGIERELFKLADYQRFAGTNAKLKTRQPVGNQRNFRGLIVGVENENVIFNDRTNGQITIPFDIIAKGNIEVDLTEELKRKDS